MGTNDGWMSGEDGIPEGCGLYEIQANSRGVSEPVMADP